MNSIFDALLKSGIYSSVVIISVIAVKAIWNGKISMKIIRLMWGIVLLRLIIPITFESPVDLGDLIEKLPEESPVYSYYYDSGTSYTAEEQTYRIENYAESVQTEQIQETEPVIDIVIEEEIGFLSEVKDILKGLSYKFYITVLWAFGALLILVKTLTDYIRFKKRIIKTGISPSLQVIALLNECKELTGVRKNVKLINSKNLSTPIMIGVLKPVIIVPKRFAGNISEDKLRMILIHELCHIKNHDVLKNMLWLIAKTIHWYNPLVWIAYKSYLSDIEIACDEKVLTYIGTDERFEYSQSLLDVIKLSKRNSKLPAVAAFCEDKTKIRKRVENMIQPKKKLKSASILSVIVSVILLIGCFTTACQSVPDVVVEYTETIADSLDNDSSEVIAESVSSAESLIQSEEYNLMDIYEEIISEEGNMNVLFDTSVIIPEDSFFSSYVIEATKLEQENIDCFLDEFFPNREAIATSEIAQLVTKQEYQDLIDEREEWIATKEDSPNEQGLSSHESWQQEIDFYTEQLVNAPDENEEIASYDITKFSYIPLIEVFRDAELTALELAEQLEETKQSVAEKNIEVIEYDILVDELNTYSIYALRSDEAGINSFSFSCEKYYPDSGIENYSDISDIQITYEEAKIIAENAIESLGIDYMDVNYASIEAYEIPRTKETGVSYHFVFTRDIDGVNVTFTEDIVNNPEVNYISWSYNYFEIWVDDDGISKISWASCSSLVIETIDENSELMDFDSILEIAKECFLSGDIKHTRSGVAIDDLLAEHNAVIYDNDIIIEKIVFGYTMVFCGENNDEYKLIPVWDFIGRESAYLEYDHYKVDIIVEATFDMSDYLNVHSFLTINALDGSVIDRRKGY